MFFRRFRWALQMMLKAEKEMNNVKILAITTAMGNTSLENVIKNTYRILDGLNRTDVRQFLYRIQLCVRNFRFKLKKLFLCNA